MGRNGVKEGAEMSGIAGGAGGPGEARTAGRRRLLALLAGGGLVLVGADRLQALSARVLAAPAAASGTDVLLLNCMDYRLVNEVTTYMNERGLTNKYDQVVLAGAALAPGSDKFPGWSQTFWDHVQAAIDLHAIQSVIALDHRDCGAYRLAFDQDFGQDPVAETAIHTAVLNQFRVQLKAKHPQLAVETFLMDLGGRVESI
jgi:hypothetical protein